VACYCLLTWLLQGGPAPWLSLLWPVTRYVCAGIVLWYNNAPLYVAGWTAGCRESRWENSWSCLFVTSLTCHRTILQIVVHLFITKVRHSLSLAQHLLQLFSLSITFIPIHEISWDQLTTIPLVKCMLLWNVCYSLFTRVGFCLEPNKDMSETLYMQTKWISAPVSVMKC
jgi:hypothetical protein